MSDARVQQIIAGIVIVIVITTICILAILGQEIPETLRSIATVAIGFLFGNVKTNGVGGSKSVARAQENPPAVL